MTREEAEKRGAPVLATIKSWASAGVDPSIMGIGPVPASRRALEKAGWEIADLDLIEANEAFAEQALSVNKELRSEEHTSELQSLMRISYAVFCLKKKKKKEEHSHTNTA